MPTAGLFAVNGPPGTGKTTLLRDLIAAVVVERATRLAQMKSPEDAFGTVHVWKVGRYTRHVAEWKEHLQGFGIVVASNNNGAVENVTLEIPGIEAVDRTWLHATDYFPEFAERLLRKPAWAMLAARLGNRTNRHEFVQRFWYTPRDVKGANAEGGEGGEPVEIGFRDVLKEFATRPIDWHAAVEAFTTALAREERLQKERVAYWETANTIITLQQEFEQSQQRLAQAKDALWSATRHEEHAASEERAAFQHFETCKQKRLEHRAFRPGILEIILTFFKAFRAWRSRDLAFAQAYEHAEGVLHTRREALDAARQARGQGEQRCDEIDAQLQATERALHAARASIQRGMGQLGAHFPDVQAWVEDEATRELSSPWADRVWNDARAMVFLEALALHKAFIAAHADTMRESLQGAIDLLTGDAPSTISGVAARAAWEALFFVIPVVSTTFASFDRLFAALGRESIGWLLIDEAGQAIPQAAVGAL